MKLYIRIILALAAAVAYCLIVMAGTGCRQSQQQWIDENGRQWVGGCVDQEAK